ncbi:HET-domain-containing protein [Stipitochalara longipes BDJ]|nr:HET-domain-containing protein [Stipitochalara longipes BDJ]
MRLLKTNTIELHEYFDAQIPPYAILSHRWGEGEVTLQKLQSGEGPQMPGYEKIFKCCAQAASDGWDYVWIDTCCIDKTSSAELSEAINSMYRWYQKSQVCYAYLVDVPDATADHSRPDSLFQQSKWFTRGWTLQELLAPTFVEFYAQNWDEIGTKSSMRTLVQKITNISTLVDIDKACVAEKLSWASTRVTTRIEDLAYCLMGLFDVNMPLLYGEGHNAFLRLQLEIWSRTNDDSIFAWGMPSLKAPHRDPSSARLPIPSLLASRLYLFEGLNGIETFERIWEQTFPKAHLIDAITLTNRGTRLDFRALEFPVIRVSPKSGFWINEFLLPLKCGRKDIGQGIQIFAIHLYQNSELNWYRDPLLELVSIEAIKANSLEPEHVLINIPHYSLKMARQVATGYAGVLFDMTSLSDDRIRVSERFCSSPPNGRAFQWTKIDDKSVLLSFDQHFSIYGLFAALRINAEWVERDIILLFEYKVLRDGGAASLSIQSLPGIQRLDDWINIQSRSALSGLFVEGNDRMACPLRDGRYISAKLKKGIYSESPVFKVTATISE